MLQNKQGYFAPGFSFCNNLRGYYHANKDGRYNVLITQTIADFFNKHPQELFQYCSIEGEDILQICAADIPELREFWQRKLFELYQATPEDDNHPLYEIIRRAIPLPSDEETSKSSLHYC